MNRSVFKWRRAVVATIFLAMLWVNVIGCSRSDAGKSASTASGNSPPVVQSKMQKRPLVLDVARDAVVVYFATPGGKYLVPVTQPINPTQRAAEVAVEKLLAGPPDKSLTRTLPEGTKIRGLSVEEKTAILDLTAEVRKLTTPAAVEQGMRSLLLTVTEFPGIDQVTLLIDGQPVTEFGGAPLNQSMPRPNVINPGPQSDARFRVQVYFSDENALYMVPLSYGIKGDATVEERARAAVEILLTGPPTQKGLSRTIWAGTKLRGLLVKNSTAIVNLSKQAIAYGGGTTAESMLLDSLVYTLTDLPEISEVQLLIEGKSVEYLPEGTEAVKPIRRPERINFLDGN